MITLGSSDMPTRSLMQDGGWVDLIYAIFSCECTAAGKKTCSALAVLGLRLKSGDSP